MLAALLRLSNDDIMTRSRAALADAGEAPRKRFVALVEVVRPWWSRSPEEIAQRCVHFALALVGDGATRAA